MKNLSDLIKAKRNECGLSQRELASKVNVDYSYIAKIESGITKKPSIEIIYKLSNALNIFFLDLLEAANYSNLEIHELTNIGKDLVFNNKVYNFIDDEELKKYLIDTPAGICIDISKILDDYKNNKNSLEQTIKLLDVCEPVYGQSNGRNTKTYFTQKGQITLDDDL